MRDSLKEIKMHTHSYIYIITNKHKNVLYLGVTNNLMRRIYEHKNQLTKGFAYRYNLDQLVYYEIYPDITTAIAREKQIKGWTRDKKSRLINSLNPTWEDLYENLC